MPFAPPKGYGKIAIGLCDKCRGSFQATCRHVQCLMLTCNNKKVLHFETPKCSSKIAFGLRHNFKAKKYLLTVQKLATLQIKLHTA